jgi:glyoxylase-like metal-dependent hydrolase (beta-lactamase superfamily II)
MATLPWVESIEINALRGHSPDNIVYEVSEESAVLIRVDTALLNGAQTADLVITTANQDPVRTTVSAVDDFLTIAVAPLASGTYAASLQSASGSYSFNIESLQSESN